MEKYYWQQIFQSDGEHLLYYHNYRIAYKCPSHKTNRKNRDNHRLIDSTYNGYNKVVDHINKEITSKYGEYWHNWKVFGYQQTYPIRSDEIGSKYIII